MNRIAFAAIQTITHGAGETGGDGEREMTEAIQKLIAENRWQPIEDAPKDGPSLIVRGGGGDIAIASWDDKGWIQKSDGYLVIESQTDFGTEYRYCDPTHFRPLPDDRLAEVCQILASTIFTLHNTATEARNIGDVHLHIDGVISALREALSRANEIAGGRE